MGSVIRVHIAPDAPSELLQAVLASGGEITSLENAEALVWTDSNPVAFPPSLPKSLTWVQLPSAGVERWYAAGIIDADRLWTSAAGAYAEAVAEHALALLLGGTRHLPLYARSREWRSAKVDSIAQAGLGGSRVGILGAGSIGRAFIGLLAPFHCDVWAVTRRGHQVPGASRTLTIDGLSGFWSAVDHVVLAAPLTASTRHIVDRRAFAQMKRSLYLVNVGRGELVDTEALLVALQSGAIAGAALDVTDPEPLPATHPLWACDNILITPHVANPRPRLLSALAERVEENVARRSAGVELLGVIELGRGY